LILVKDKDTQLIFEEYLTENKLSNLALAGMSAFMAPNTTTAKEEPTPIVQQVDHEQLQKQYNDNLKWIEKYIEEYRIAEQNDDVQGQLFFAQEYKKLRQANEKFKKQLR